MGRKQFHFLWFLFLDKEMSAGYITVKNGQEE